MSKLLASLTQINAFLLARPAYVGELLGYSLSFADFTIEISVESEF